MNSRRVGALAFVVLFCAPALVMHAQHYQQIQFLTESDEYSAARRSAYTVRAEELANGTSGPMEPDGVPSIAHCVTGNRTASIVCKSPTSAVLNDGAGFEIAAGRPALVIFVGHDGSIAGWNPDWDPKRAVSKVRASTGAVYKGAAIGQVNGDWYLYVGNFRSGHVEVYDAHFEHEKPLEQRFRTASHKDFGPTSIHSVDGVLIVTYAKQDLRRAEALPGPGTGFVEVFRPSGEHLRSLEQGPWLDSPSGVAMAPSTFGEFSNALLVGNRGTGYIAAYDLATGSFKGLLKDAKDALLSVAGLRALTSSSVDRGGKSYVLYSAEEQDQAGSAFGMLTPIP